MKRELLADRAAFSQALNHCRIALATKQMLTLGDVEQFLGVSLGVQERTLPLSVKGFNEKIVPQLVIIHHKGPVLHKETLKETSALTPEIDLDTGVYEAHPLDSLNWLPPRNPKQTANLYPAQTKASKDLVYKLIIENRRGVLLRASVGVGKTYMYGQFIRWLFDEGSLFKDCISPWPCLIITKASIVEQTRRVIVNEFGLDGYRQVNVINYDALRSSKGLETMIEMKYEVHGGIRHEVFKWRPYLRPRLIIVDESQAAKNEDSKQTKIIAALSDANLDNTDPIRIIFSSATPFTRVSEAKYAVINMGIPYRMI